MGRLKGEDERGKERLASYNKDKKGQYICANCKNNTFVMTKVSDFPFYDTICSKCGSMFIWEGK